MGEKGKHRKPDKTGGIIGKQERTQENRENIKQGRYRKTEENIEEQGKTQENRRKQGESQVNSRKQEKKGGNIGEQGKHKKTEGNIEKQGKTQENGTKQGES